MADENISTGELARSLNEFKQDVRDNFRETRQQIASLKFVSLDAYLAAHKDLENQIAEVKQEQKAMRKDASANRRAIVTSLILPFIVGVALILAGIALR